VIVVCALFNVTDSTAITVGTGVLLANLCHFGSVLALYQLARTAQRASPRRDQIAFVTAALHVCSPAGIFLVAPYSEALFSLLSFTGLWAYAYGFQSSSSLLQVPTTLLAGGLLAVSATVRGNGLLFASIFAYDAGLLVVQQLTPLFSQEVFLLISAFAVGRTATLYKSKDLVFDTALSFLQDFDAEVVLETLGGPLLIGIASSVASVGFSVAYMLNLIPFIKEDAAHARFSIGLPAILSGLFVVAGYSYPQYLAYQQFCTSESSGPAWCTAFPPSIFTSIQSRYW
jgi:Gpi18-like mannosyltransferase